MQHWTGAWFFHLCLLHSQPKMCRSLYPPVFLCFLSARMKRSRSALFSYLHLFSFCACLHSLNQPQSLWASMQPDWTCVYRIRGIISLLLPLSLPFSRSPSQCWSPSSSSHTAQHCSIFILLPSRFLSTLHLSPCRNQQEQGRLFSVYMHRSRMS